VNAVPDEPCHGVLDLRLLKVIERFGRDVDAGNLDSRIEHAEQRVLDGLKIVLPRRYSAVAVDLKIWTWSAAILYLFVVVAFFVIFILLNLFVPERPRFQVKEFA